MTDDNATLDANTVAEINKVAAEERAQEQRAARRKPAAKKVAEEVKEAEREVVEAEERLSEVIHHVADMPAAQEDAHPYSRTPAQSVPGVRRGA